MRTFKANYCILVGLCSLCYALHRGFCGADTCATTAWWDTFSTLQLVFLANQRPHPINVTTKENLTDVNLHETRYRQEIRLNASTSCGPVTQTVDISNGSSHRPVTKRPGGAHPTTDKNTGQSSSFSTSRSGAVATWKIAAAKPAPSISALRWSAAEDITGYWATNPAIHATTEACRAHAQSLPNVSAQSDLVTDAHLVFGRRGRCRQRIRNPHLLLNLSSQFCPGVIYPSRVSQKNPRTSHALQMCGYRDATHAYGRRPPTFRTAQHSVCDGVLLWDILLEWDSPSPRPSLTASNPLVNMAWPG